MKQTLSFQEIKIPMTDLGEESSLPDLLGISVLQNELQFDLGETDEIFEGYGRTERMYPYRMYDNYGRELAMRTAKAAILESDDLKAVFLTEFGGRLWELWDKKRNKNLLYTNDVLRFRNLASRNAWFSGGVEWNIGVMGHCPLTTEVMHAARTQTEKGEPVLRMYQYERIRKVIWQMDFWLEEGCPYLNCGMRIYNESADVVPMYWWSNMAVPEHENGRVIVPADSAYTNKKGLVYKVDIPMVEGIDITDYNKIPYSVDYFFDIPEKTPKYVANVDAGGNGLLHVSTNRLQSRKLFSWGHQTASEHWQEFLTQAGGPYIEIQAGLGKTQYGCLPMAPHTTWEWVEQYGAVSIPKADMEISHQERAEHLTQSILEQGIPQNLEELSARWHKFSKSQAVSVSQGKQYGALGAVRKNSGHLVFELNEESLRNWRGFFHNGILHEPKPEKRPDEFMIDGTNLSFMEQACEREENAGNWYAFYHLGLGYFVIGDYVSAAEALEKSNHLAENPWAKHALSCTYFKLGDKAASIRYILEGMYRCREDHSYLKEGFRILIENEAYESLCEFYTGLEAAKQEIGRLKFYFALALHRLGNTERALEILENNGGIEMEDIREGECSMEELWEVICGKKGCAPYQYRFRASEG